MLISFQFYKLNFIYLSNYIISLIFLNILYSVLYCNSINILVKEFQGFGIKYGRKLFNLLSNLSPCSVTNSLSMVYIIPLKQWIAGKHCIPANRLLLVYH